MKRGMCKRQKKINVVMVRPLGKGGKGGIDRVVQNQIDAFIATDIRIFEIVTRGPHGLIAARFYLLFAILKLIAIYLLQGVDLVHINLSSNGSVVRKKIIIRICQKLAIPYVIHLHGSRFRSYWDGLAERESRQLTRCFEEATTVFALGEVWRQYIISKAPSARVELLLNATPPAPNKEASPQRKSSVTKILFLGEIGQRKGAFDLIEAVSSLDSQKLGSWELTLAGNGDLEKAAGLISKKNLDHRVALPGWVDEHTAEALLTQAHILVLPSYDENLPMSVIEGMAHGLAIVTTPVGATASIIRHEDNGLLIPPGDITALTDALKVLICDIPLAQSLGQQARQFHTENLTISIHVERLAHLWREAAGK